VWQSGEVSNGGPSKERRLATLGALLAYDPASDERELPPGAEQVATPAAAGLTEDTPAETASGAPAATVDGASPGGSETGAGAEETGASVQAGQPAAPEPAAPAAPAAMEPRAVCEIQNAARDIANTLTGILTATLAEVNERASEDRRRLDGVAAALDQASERLSRTEKLVDGFHRSQQGLTAHVESILSRISAVESRLDNLAGKLDEISARAQQQTDALTALSASSASLAKSHQALNARLILTERALRAAETDRKQRDVTWERFVASLGNLEMRGEKRFPANENVRAVLLGEEEKTVRAQVLDVSERGLGLFLEAEVPVGGTLRIDVEDASLSGTVRYCRPYAEGFSAGLLLDQPLSHQGGDGQ
jgi:hypothetical protein